MSMASVDLIHIGTVDLDAMILIISEAYPFKFPTDLLVKSKGPSFPWSQFKISLTMNSWYYGGDYQKEGWFNTDNNIEKGISEQEEIAYLVGNKEVLEIHGLAPSKKSDIMD